MNIPLSNEQLNKALNIDNSYIVKYSELDNFTTLSELFGTNHLLYYSLRANIIVVTGSFFIG